MVAHLATVLVSNFRSIHNENFKLALFTPLVGYNNSGKSNLVSAINWLLRKSVLSAGDFKNVATAVEVQGQIVGISDTHLDMLAGAQRAQVAPFVRDGVLKIKRTQPSPGCAAKDILLYVLDPADETWKRNPTGIDAAIGVLFPEPIRIGAMEDAAEDASKAKSTTTIGKLLAEFIAPVRAAHEQELIHHLAEIERRISADGDTRFAELITIEDAISRKIADLFPGIGARLHFSVPKMDDLIKAGTLRLYEGDGGARDFGSYGHGTQRSVQMALIRHLADVKRSGERAGSTTLLLIDEPELYLHPFAIEQVRAALKTLSANGYQVIFSTHSAQMIPAEDAQHALLMRKSPERGTYSRERLKDAISVIVPRAEHQTEFLFSLGNSSQILFSDCVVLAEGKTERRLLPAIYPHITGKTLGQNKMSLIAQEGSGSTIKSMEILRAMDIPCLAVVDLDFALKEATKAGLIPSTDPSVVAILSIFSRLAPVHDFKIGNDGFPCKGGTLSAAEAFETLAMDAEALDHITSIHERLKEKGIWAWKMGAIERHLALAGKSEAIWSEFQLRLEKDGLETTCPEHLSVREMLEWATNAHQQQGSASV